MSQQTNELTETSVAASLCRAVRYGTKEPCSFCINEKIQGTVSEKHNKTLDDYIRSQGIEDFVGICEFRRRRGYFNSTEEYWRENSQEYYDENRGYGYESDGEWIDVKKHLFNVANPCVIQDPLRELLERQFYNDYPKDAALGEVNFFDLCRDISPVDSLVDIYKNVAAKQRAILWCENERIPEFLGEKSPMKKLLKKLAIEKPKMSIQEVFWEAFMNGSAIEPLQQTYREMFDVEMPKELLWSPYKKMVTLLEEYIPDIYKQMSDRRYEEYDRKEAKKKRLERNHKYSIEAESVFFDSLNSSETEEDFISRWNARPFIIRNTNRDLHVIFQICWSKGWNKASEIIDEDNNASTNPRNVLFERLILSDNPTEFMKVLEDRPLGICLPYTKLMELEKFCLDMKWDVSLLSQVRSAFSTSYPQRNVDGTNNILSIPFETFIELLKTSETEEEFLEIWNSGSSYQYNSMSTDIALTICDGRGWISLSRKIYDGITAEPLSKYLPPPQQTSI